MRLELFCSSKLWVIFPYAIGFLLHFVVHLIWLLGVGLTEMKA